VAWHDEAVSMSELADTSQSDWLMKIVRAVFFQKFAMEAISMVFKFGCIRRYIRN
jgi:hypothetical protein